MRFSAIALEPVNCVTRGCANSSNSLVACRCISSAIYKKTGQDLRERERETERFENLHEKAKTRAWVVCVSCFAVAAEEVDRRGVEAGVDQKPQRLLHHDRVAPVPDEYRFAKTNIESLS